MNGNKDSSNGVSMNDDNTNDDDEGDNVRDLTFDEYTGVDEHDKAKPNMNATKIDHQGTRKDGVLLDIKDEYFRPEPDEYFEPAVNQNDHVQTRTKTNDDQTQSIDVAANTSVINSLPVYILSGHDEYFVPLALGSQQEMIQMQDVNFFVNTDDQVTDADSQVVYDQVVYDQLADDQVIYDQVAD